MTEERLKAGLHICLFLPKTTYRRVFQDLLPENRWASDGLEGRSGFCLYTIEGHKIEFYISDLDSEQSIEPPQYPKAGR